jgi:hypothetical protein
MAKGGKRPGAGVKMPTPASPFIEPMSRYLAVLAALLLSLAFINLPNSDGAAATGKAKARVKVRRHRRR